MAHYPLTGSTILLGAFDLSGDMNSVSVERSQAALADDTFGAANGAAKTFLARKPGLQDGVIGMAGFVELTDDGQDERIHANMSLTNVPVMVALRGATYGYRSKFGLLTQGQYQAGGNVGELAKWSADGRISNYALTDGIFVGAGGWTNTVNVAAQELGAVSASQKLYAQIHATAKTSFTSAVFKIQSSATQGGSYTDRIVFATITDLTSQYATPVAGPITDSWFRLAVTAFTGTLLTAYAAVGIS